MKRNKRLNVLPENPEQKEGIGRFPSWLHRKLPKGGNLLKTENAVRGSRLHTVCEEAKCPNRLQCWSQKTATFLVLGKECTRACGFCDIDFSKAPKPPEEDEPMRVASSVKELGLRHVVITMVARDDLSDKGASHLAKIMKEIRRQVPTATLEVLTSDFSGDEESIRTVLLEKPEIFNHNLETVRELTPRVRHKATYDRTLQVLRAAKGHCIVKSGLMVGLGETEEMVKESIRDLKEAGCDIITIGQYLQPNNRKLRVKAFVTPEQFKKYEDYGHSIGIKHMYCGPFVRSSFNAGEVLEKVRKK
ncbi:MAG: lipoyl synthase [Waddliaceae bacterium]